MEIEPRTLPVYRHEGELIEAIRTHRVVVVEGPTGSGKTTQIPQILLQSGLVDGIIGVTQPRRIAAVSVARRIAVEMGVPLGDAVGYAIRFEDVTGPHTLLKIMTDGILLQEARSSRDFAAYGLVMIDEAHERSLNIDLCLGLLHQALERRKDLRVVVSSATLKPEEFQAFFSDLDEEVPRVTIQGRPFPIKIEYLPQRTRGRLELAEAVADQVTELHRYGERGHILVFLTGEEMIEKTSRSLAFACPDRDLVVLPVFGRMKREEQDRVFDDFAGQRKVVLATNIAETSITIPDVRYVVDSGWVKLPRFNSQTQVSALQEEPVSQASAAQRAGRAGRTGPGKVVRLYDRATLMRQPEFTDEEVKRQDLSEVVLRLIDLGIKGVEDFPFPTPPSRKLIRAALSSLRSMGAIDRDRDLTSIGRRMVPFPLSPFLARMVIEAADRFPDVVDEVIVAGAFLSVRSPFLMPLGEEEQAREMLEDLAHPLGDTVTAVSVYKRWAAARDREAYCQEHYLDPDILAFIEKAHAQLADLAREGGIAIRGGGSPEGVVRCLAAACADRVLMREGRGKSYVTPLGIPVAVHPSSVLFGTRQAFLVAAELVLSTRTYARQVSLMEPEWVKEVNPEAASRWRIKVKGGRKARQRPEIAVEAPRGVQIGELFLALSRHRDRYHVSIGPREVEALRSMQPWDVPVEHSRWPAEVACPQGRFLTGMTLARLVAILPHVRLPRPDDVLAGDIPEGVLLDVQDDRQTLDTYLVRLMEPAAPASGKQPGWLALVANGMGRFWFEVMHDYLAALQSSVVSLDDLLQVLGAAGSEDETAAAAHARLSETLDQVERTLEELRKRHLG